MVQYTALTRLDLSSKIFTSGYGAVGSALVWGARGREFKSRYSDQQIKDGLLPSFFVVVIVD